MIFPTGEEKCLTRGQKLTDGMIDHLAGLVLEAWPSGARYIPTFMWRIGEVDWTPSSPSGKVFTIMNHDEHWFLLVFHNGVFHLYDSLPSEEESVIDIQDLPVGDDDVIEDYYGQIPNQGNSKTNCGVHAILNMIYVLFDLTPSYDPATVNPIVRPFLKRSLHEGGFDVLALMAILS